MIQRREMAWACGFAWAMISVAADMTVFQLALQRSLRAVSCDFVDRVFAGSKRSTKSHEEPRNKSLSSSVRIRLGFPQIAPCHLPRLFDSQQSEHRRRNILEGAAFAKFHSARSFV